MSEQKQEWTTKKKKRSCLGARAARKSPRMNGPTFMISLSYELKPSDHER
jgi:hypothetical protein